MEYAPCVECAQKTALGVEDLACTPVFNGNICYERARPRDSQQCAGAAEAVTPDDLAALCAGWQRRLRLEDWTIQVALVPEADREDAWGTNRVYAEKKACRIGLMAPGDRHPVGGWPAPPLEQTLIHELLHLHFLPWATDDSSDENYVVLEQGVELIAEALYQLARGG